VAAVGSMSPCDVATLGSFMASSASARPLPSRWVLPYPRPRNNRVGAANRDARETKGKRASCTCRARLEPRGESTTSSRSWNRNRMGCLIWGRIVGRLAGGAQASLWRLESESWIRHAGRSTEGAQEAGVSRGFAVCVHVYTLWTDRIECNGKVCTFRNTVCSANLTSQVVFFFAFEFNKLVSRFSKTKDPSCCGPCSVFFFFLGKGPCPVYFGRYWYEHRVPSKVD